MTEPKAESWELRVEPREYQRNIALSACNRNTLVVLPTGLGKTIVAMLVADYRLREEPTSQGEMNKNVPPAGSSFDPGARLQIKGTRRGRVVLVMAPTRPLAVQHRASFRDAFASLPEDSFALLTGDDSPEEREKIWKGNGDNDTGVDGNASSSSSPPYTSASTNTFIFATPETVLNDLRAGRLSLRNFVLLVFDEAHRCVKDYAYTEIARLYMEQAVDPLILGLTASPGSTPEAVEEVMKSLYAVAVEARAEEDEDVVQYVEDTRVRTVRVKLPEDFKPLINELRTLYNEKIWKLRRFGLFKGERFVSKKMLLEARQTISARLRGAGGAEPFSSSRGYLFAAITVQSQAVIIVHAIELIETQGVTTLSKYLDKLRHGTDQGKSAKALLKDERWVAIEEKASKLVNKIKEKGMRHDHPKIGALMSLITEQFARKPSSKVIIFTQYRDTIDAVISTLSSSSKEVEEMSAVKPRKFVGQSTKSETDKGMNQKLQKEVLEKFRSGDEFNVLVSSSIGEEGLHVPDVDLVIFYEAVPSAIRSIQRKGRTGRTMPGSVAILISEGTVDESYYHATTYKEKLMKKLVADSSKGQEEENVVKKEEEDPVLVLDEIAKSTTSPTLMDFMG